MSPRHSTGEPETASGGRDAAEMERRLAARAALLREALAEREQRLERLETRGDAPPVRAARVALREELASLRDELECLHAASRAVATLRPTPPASGLPDHRDERSAGDPRRRSP